MVPQPPKVRCGDPATGHDGQPVSDDVAHDKTLGRVARQGKPPTGYFRGCGDRPRSLLIGPKCGTDCGTGEAVDPENP